VKGGPITEIIEVSCQYGYISHEADTLNRAFEEKNAKYRDLSNILSRVTHQKVRLTSVIVSSMGAVFGEPLRRLKTVLRCEDRQMNRVGRKMSDAALIGSMQIWQLSAKEIARESVRARGEEEYVEIDVAEMEYEQEVICGEDE
jgi:hypothetical protein